MNSKPPDTATTKAALALAVRAPSIHNSQPWRWRVGAANINLFIDPARRLSHVDPAGRGMVLSCGVALQHCTVALPALGWATEVHRFPNPGDSNHVASVDIIGSSTSAADIARAGEATGAVLLSATAMGLASCPLTEPLEIAATRDEVRTKLLGGEDFPHMLLRVGWAAVNADSLPATPRRPLTDAVVGVG